MPTDTGISKALNGTRRISARIGKPIIIAMMFSYECLYTLSLLVICQSSVPAELQRLTSQPCPKGHAHVIICVVVGLSINNNIYRSLLHSYNCWHPFSLRLFAHHLQSIDLAISSDHVSLCIFLRWFHLPSHLVRTQQYTQFSGAMNLRRCYPSG